jgi:hypothetical protein
MGSKTLPQLLSPFPKRLNPEKSGGAFAALKFSGARYG